MNHLNSILLEGTLIENPKVFNTSDLSSIECFFPVESVRYVKQNGKASCEASHITIQVKGQLAENSLKTLDTGRNIRVVGRLKERGEKDYKDLPVIFIQAEHIEIKPILETRK